MFQRIGDVMINRFGFQNKFVVSHNKCGHLNYKFNTQILDLLLFLSYLYNFLVYKYYSLFSLMSNSIECVRRINGF